MATLKIEITASNTALAKYADDLGYKATINGFNPDGTTKTEDNPQSKPEFLAERVKDIVAAALAQQASQSIKRTKVQEAETQTATLLTNIKGATTVTIV